LVDLVEKFAPYTAKLLFTLSHPSFPAMAHRNAQNQMARASEKRVEIKIEGKLYSGRYSVQGGIMTLHLGTEAKQARVGRACHRVLARILLYRHLRELLAAKRAA
jgi:hypothetical protein